MITLPCTHCQKTLTLDEAFAGGVCRCQHCGTIQTVPSHLKKGASKSGPRSAARTLYQSGRAVAGAEAAAMESSDGAGAGSGAGGERSALPVKSKGKSALIWLALLAVS